MTGKRFTNNNNNNKKTDNPQFWMWSGDLVILNIEICNYMHGIRPLQLFKKRTLSVQHVFETILILIRIQ
jgi:hypothetical protein